MMTTADPPSIEYKGTYYEADKSRQTCDYCTKMNDKCMWPHSDSTTAKACFQCRRYTKRPCKIDGTPVTDPKKKPIRQEVKRAEKPYVLILTKPK